MLELALIENLQREDLNPIEEAHAYRRLAQDFSLRQEDIAQRVGKSRSVVANSLRLLDLHSQVQSYLTQGRLTVGHAKVLLALQNPDEHLIVAERAIREAATVRMTERLVAAQLARQGLTKSGKTGVRPSHEGSAGVHHAVSHLENRLRERLATHVTIHHGEKKGRIEIQYYGNDDLDRILSLLGVSVLVRSAGVGGHGNYSRSKERINARSAFGMVWLFSLFFFVSSCKPGNNPASANAPKQHR